MEDRDQTFRDGVLISETIREVPAWEANERAVYQRARTALAANRDFLALTSPTNAQTLAQVKALTRQVNALIRLTLHQFDKTD